MHTRINASVHQYPALIVASATGLVAGGLRGYLEHVQDPAVFDLVGVASADDNAPRARRSCRVRAIMVTSLREKIRSSEVEFANCLTFLPIALPIDKPGVYVCVCVCVCVCVYVCVCIVCGRVFPWR